MVPEFSAVYQEHAQRLLAFLAARCPTSDVEDLAHDIWLKVAQALGSQFVGQNFRAWIFQIARNHLNDHYRKRRPDELLKSVVIRDEPLSGLLDEERKAILTSCLEGLTDRERCVFQTRCAGEDYEEVCRRCGCNTNGAQKALHSAKRKLRACVERKLN